MKESSLVETFGGFTVESATFPEVLRSITFFCTLEGVIFGISASSALESQAIGRDDNALVKHQFDIIGPNEVIEEVVVQTASGGGGDMVITVCMLLQNSYE